ncbi:MAG: serine protease [Acholeplasma sp.]|nr:MAG: serine protease [Acholeplasma sp.]
MKKIMIVFVLILSSLMLMSCNRELSPEELLANQYDAYLNEDIMSEEYFDQYINEISNFTIPGMVIVKTTIRDNLGILLQEKEGSGFIYQIYDDSLRVVTSYDVVTTDIPNATLTVQIYDFASRAYTALVLNRSEELGLAKIIFDTKVSIAKVRKLLFSPYIPLDNEPIMMISNYQQVHNSMLMGLLSSKDLDNDFYYVNIPVDQYVKGGAVINMRNQVIGVVVDFTEDQAVILGLNTLREYLGV